MAITRRQFVTRLGALAAAVGMSQPDISRITEAFAGNSTNFGGTLGKPRVVWIHGAECTGCSTSLLGILESGTGQIYGTGGITTGAALGLAGVNDAFGDPGTTLGNVGLNLDGGLVSIADVVIDVIDLQYHETVMGMGGDLAAQWLQDFKENNEGLFVLVVEGALQPKGAGNTGAWDDTSDTSLPWCSIGTSDQWDAEDPAGSISAGEFEHDTTETVEVLAGMASCLAVLPIGQCACYGGYPGCTPTIRDSEAGTPATGGFDRTQSQTGALGVHAYLKTVDVDAAAKVVNVPGCPTNPWWFVLTVVAYMVDANYVLNNPGGTATPLGILQGGSVTPLAFNPNCIDGTDSNRRRLKVTYPANVHSGKCPRYQYYTTGVYALKPGDTGCLQRLGCKGLGTRSLCGLHGWNNMQPENGAQATVNSPFSGGHCTTAGAPCMGCTETGYPNRFVPFVRL